MTCDECVVWDTRPQNRELDDTRTGSEGRWLLHACHQHFSFLTQAPGHSWQTLVSRVLSSLLLPKQ